ncbi:hypothetical protein QBC47DRAFT_434157, partial [Echria macrotheca]
PFPSSLTTYLSNYYPCQRETKTCKYQTSQYLPHPAPLQSIVNSSNINYPQSQPHTKTTNMTTSTTTDDTETYTLTTLRDDLATGSRTNMATFIRHKARQADFSPLTPLTSALTAESFHPNLDPQPRETYSPEQWVEDVLSDVWGSITDSSIILVWRDGHLTLRAEYDMHPEIRRGWEARYPETKMGAPLWRAVELGTYRRGMLMDLLELVLEWDLMPAWERAWDEGKLKALVDQMEG